jgi:hypothetical protein
MEQKSMSDNGNDFLDDMTEQLAAPETPETPEPEQPAAEVETVEKPPETPAPEVTTTPEPKEEQAVPYAAMKAERDKRQALEKELAELRAAQQAAPQQPAPDFFDAPDQYVQAMEQRTTARFHAALAEQAREVYPDYDEKFALVLEAAKGNPAIEAQILNAANPALAAYKLGAQLAEFQRMQDPAKYRAEIEAEVRAKFEAEQKAKEQARAKADAEIPPDMTQARNAAGQFAPQDDDVFTDLFN